MEIYRLVLLVRWIPELELTLMFITYRVSLPDLDRMIPELELISVFIAYS